MVGAGGAVVVPGGRRRTVRAQLQQSRLAAARLRRSGAVGVDQSEPRRLPAEASCRRSIARIIERVEAIPGVQSATIAMCGVMTGCRSNSDGIAITGYTSQPGEQVVLQENRVGPNYFSTVGMTIVGRPRFRCARNRQQRARSPSSTKRWCASTSRAATRSASASATTSPTSKSSASCATRTSTRVREAAAPMVFYPLDATPSLRRLDANPRHRRSGIDRRRGARRAARDRAAAAGRSRHDDRDAGREHAAAGAIDRAADDRRSASWRWRSRASGSTD